MASIAQTNPAHHVKSPVRAALGSFAGAVMDWFDFYVYGTVAALVFPKLFFPGSDPATGVLLTFATFGVGFLARPLGGIVFGHFGDKVGRKAMLVATLIFMGAATALIGCLPTYQSVGVWAPIMLVGLRFAQGIAVGGEWAGAALMAVEHSPEGRRGFFGSFVQVGAFIGLFVATGSVSLVNAFTTNDEFLAWGWRLPFLFSVVVILVGYLIRMGVAESPEFLTEVKDAKQEAKTPLLEAIRRYPGAFLKIFAMRFAELIPFYTFSVFALQYGTANFGLPRSVLLNAVMIVGIVAVVVSPSMGALSDKIGRRPVYVAGALIGMCMAFPLFWAIESKNMILIFAAFILTANFCCNVVTSVQQPLFTEMFDVAFRYSGAGFAYQLASAITGGFTPLIEAGLVNWAGGGYTYVAIYMASACLISAIVGFIYAGKPGYAAPKYLETKN